MLGLVVLSGFSGIFSHTSFIWIFVAERLGLGWHFWWQVPEEGHQFALRMLRGTRDLLQISEGHLRILCKLFDVNLADDPVLLGFCLVQLQDLVLVQRCSSRSWRVDRAGCDQVKVFRGSTRDERMKAGAHILRPLLDRHVDFRLLVEQWFVAGHRVLLVECGVWWMPFYSCLAVVEFVCLVCDVVVVDSKLPRVQVRSWVFGALLSSLMVFSFESLINGILRSCPR